MLFRPTFPFVFCLLYTCPNPCLVAMVPDDCSYIDTVFCRVLMSNFGSFLGLTYLLIYRTEKYKKLTAEVEKHSKKCEFLPQLPSLCCAH